MSLLILVINVVIMFLFWCAGLIFVTPAYNHFVQYGNAGDVLPSFTQCIVDFRFFMFLIPMLWIFLSFKVQKKIQNKKSGEQIKILLLFSLTTLSGGLMMIIIFALAGILPYLKIGSAF